MPGTQARSVGLGHEPAHVDAPPAFVQHTWDPGQPSGESQTTGAAPQDSSHVAVAPAQQNLPTGHFVPNRHAMAASGPVSELASEDVSCASMAPSPKAASPPSPGSASLAASAIVATSAAATSGRSSPASTVPPSSPGAVAPATNGLPPHPTAKSAAAATTTVIAENFMPRERCRFRAVTVPVTRSATPHGEPHCALAQDCAHVQ